MAEGTPRFGVSLPPGRSGSQLIAFRPAGKCISKGKGFFCPAGTPAPERVGYYQEKGKPIQTLHAGDVVKILPGVEHWHGASATSNFTHIAINVKTEKGVVNGLKPVTDGEDSRK
jgi:hypothetical protein